MNNDQTECMTMSFSTCFLFTKGGVRDILVHNELLVHCAGRTLHVQMNMFACLHLWHVLRLMMTDHCKHSLNAQHTQAWGNLIVYRAWVVFQTHNNSQTDDLNKICIPQI